MLALLSTWACANRASGSVNTLDHKPPGSHAHGDNTIAVTIINTMSISTTYLFPLHFNSDCTLVRNGISQRKSVNPSWTTTTQDICTSLH